MRNLPWLSPIIFSLYITGFVYWLGTPSPWWHAGAVVFLAVGLYGTFGRYYRYAMVLFWGATILWGLFFRYFHRSPTTTDIALFFSHMEETFESLGGLYGLFVPVVLWGVLGVWLLWYLPLPTQRATSKKWYFATLTALMFSFFTTEGMGFLRVLASFPFQKKSVTRTLWHEHIPLYPQRRPNYHIIVLLGESLRYDAYVAQKLQTLQGNIFYKKIYAGATNTDVSVPLFFNTLRTTEALGTQCETNLFKLAKRSGYETAFISVQTPQALRYIKPYLQPSFIDRYVTYSKAQRSPLYDRLLLDELKKTDFAHKQFIVMQQIGQHAPYRYYAGAAKEGDIPFHYYRSVDESFRLYEKMLQLLEQRAGRFVFVYLSDHGELMGEGGRYGHNTFAPEVYFVPFFIAGNTVLPSHTRAIRSHHDLSLLIRYFLGYGTAFTPDRHPVRVNGTMLSGEDGFRVF